MIKTGKKRHNVRGKQNRKRLSANIELKQNLSTPLGPEPSRNVLGSGPELEVVVSQPSGQGSASEQESKDSKEEKTNELKRFMTELESWKGGCKGQRPPDVHPIMWGKNLFFFIDTVCWLFHDSRWME